MSMDEVERVNEVRAGRIVGALFLLQFAAGIAINTVLTAPLFAEGGYLLHAAAAGQQLGFSVLLALVGCLLTVAIATLAFPSLRARSQAWATGFLCLSVLAAGSSAVEQAGILAMRAYSESYMAADEVQRSILQASAASGALLRNGMHYVNLLLSGANLALWYGGALRYRLLPRPLAVLGVIAVVLQLYSISRPVLGGDVSFPLLAPLALTQLLLCAWLLWRGFPDPAEST